MRTQRIQRQANRKQRRESRAAHKQARRIERQERHRLRFEHKMARRDRRSERLTVSTGSAPGASAVDTD